MPPGSNTVIVDRPADGVGRITLNRPEVLNALNHDLLRGLVDAVARLEADDAVRAVIVTGEGRGFCAGADLQAGGETCYYRARGVADEVPRVDSLGPTWVEPVLVVDVESLGPSAQGRLRQPSYIGTRADLTREDLT